MSNTECIVSSYNDWDPLEEIIIGSVEYAARMAFEPSIHAYYTHDSEMKKFKGARFPQEEINAAENQLDKLAQILEKEGVIVKRPACDDFMQPFKTPDFEVPCGNCSACPRDVLLIIGNEIIEAPMAQRARYFEYRAYRDLTKEYFKHGAKWVSAPKPLMSNKLYVENYSVDQTPFDSTTHPALTEFEPCFDAASFVRFGRDIFYQPDLVSNDFGAQWLERHLGGEFRVHKIEFQDHHPPQHIDTTLVPIRPGLILVNPERPCINNGLNIFYQNNWEVVEATPSVQSVEFHSPEVSNWISMNILNIDENRVIVEEKEEGMMRLLESLGCQPIPCPFDKVYKFGGGFHCCTLDVRRRGSLKSYFSKID